MADLLLSSPMVWLYLLHVAALVIAALLCGPPQPFGSGRGPQAVLVRAGHPPSPNVGGRRPGLPAWRFRREREGRELLPVRELAASCSLDYAVRFAQAIKQIRMR